MSNIFEQVGEFKALFEGLDTAFGTGAGRWVKRAPTPTDWLEHLSGEGPGIGIAPLRPDNTVKFAAIDLDEPDFKAAFEMTTYLPGPAHIERSRSGNAHVWVFFSDPIEAWIPMGILREAASAAGKPRTEIFPKNHDFTKVRLGNYINLPFHGTSRPTLERVDRTMYDPGQVEADGGVDLGNDKDGCLMPQDLSRFLEGAQRKNDPNDWRKRATWLLIDPPEERESTREFGKQAHLHMCAEWILDRAESHPVTAGHRSIVYFSLAKMLTNCTLYSHAEALDFLRAINRASPDKVPDYELRRILGNAERGQFTSTGCDDPVFVPYAHPLCKIANRNG